MSDLSKEQKILYSFIKRGIEGLNEDEYKESYLHYIRKVHRFNVNTFITEVRKFNVNNPIFDVEVAIVFANDGLFLEDEIRLELYYKSDHELLIE